MTDALDLATRSFRDLRAFAAAATIPADTRGDPYLVSRAALDLPQGPVSVSLVVLPQGRGRVDILPDDEFLILLEGALILEGTDETVQLAVNQSAVITKGTGFTWSSREGSRLIALRRNGSPPAPPPSSPSTKARRWSPQVRH